jgi:hypothetical protein
MPSLDATLPRWITGPLLGLVITATAEADVL